jgi:hypothetical protein
LKIVAAGQVPGAKEASGMTLPGHDGSQSKRPTVALELKPSAHGE